MKTKKGMILLQVLVMSAILMFSCVSLVKQCLQSKVSVKKSITTEDAAGNMEGVTAKAWACLNDAGYPSVGRCNPTSQQLACVPSGAAVSFTGSYPACRIVVNVDK